MRDVLLHMRARVSRVAAVVCALRSANNKRVHDHHGAHDTVALLTVFSNSTLDQLYVEDDMPGVAVPVMYHDVVEQMLTFPERRPFLFNLICAVICKVVGDVIVQLFENRLTGKSGLDWKRVQVFLVFGLLYAGFIEWYLYVDLFAHLLPNAILFANEPIETKLVDHTGQFHYLMQVFLDNCVICLFVYLPVFYILKEFIQGSSSPCCESFKRGLTRYVKNLPTDSVCAWMVGVPGDLLIFAVPMWSRMPVNHFISFVWTVGLSYLRGAEVDGSNNSKSPAASGNDGLVRAI